METSMEARLHYLETREDSYSRDLIRLKTENAELHTMVFELKRESLRAVDKSEQMESRFQKMQEDLKTVFGFRTTIENRLGILEKNVTHLKDIDDRVSGLETALNGFRQEAACADQSFHNRLVKLEEQTDKRLDKCGDKNLVEERLTRLETTIEDRLKKLETNINIGQVKVENKDCNSSHQTLELRLKKAEDSISLSQRQFERGLKKVEEMKSKSPDQDFEQELQKVQNNMTVFQQNFEQRLKKVENKQSTSQQQIEKRLKKVEIEMSTPQKIVEDRLDKIENDVTTFRQEFTRHQQSVTSKMKNREIKVKHLKDIDDRVVALETTTNGLRQETACNDLYLHKKLDEMEGELENKTSETERRVDTLIKSRDAISNSVTRVNLNTSQRLKLDELTKLDKVTEVVYNTGYFNVTSACLEPPVAGKYLVNVEYYQGGTGKLNLYVKTDIHNLFWGRTIYPSDAVNSMHAISLKKGQKLWVESGRSEGDAYIYWCIMTVWLIAPDE